MTAAQFKKEYNLSDLEFDRFRRVWFVDPMSAMSLHKFGSGTEYLTVPHPVHTDIEIMIAIGISEAVKKATLTLFKKGYIELYRKGEPQYWRYGSQGNHTFYTNGQYKPLNSVSIAPTLEGKRLHSLLDWISPFATK